VNGLYLAHYAAGYNEAVVVNAVGTWYMYIHIIVFQHLTRLCSTVAETVRAFCIDYCLQTALYQTGSLWHLLLFLFNYDYTLEESGVTTEQVGTGADPTHRLPLAPISQNCKEMAIPII